MLPPPQTALALPRSEEYLFPAFQSFNPVATFFPSSAQSSWSVLETRENSLTSALSPPCP